jgi:Flp pilus assembly protein CpaB
VIGSEIPVVVAAQDVARGTQLEASMLEVERIPSKFAPPGAVASVEDVAGRTLAADVLAGEAVTRARVGAEGAGEVAALVPTGLRAMTVDAGVPPGSVRPGDRVDVLATFGGQHPHTETVATGLEVLLVLDSDGSTGSISATGGSGSGGPTLVLLVSPDAAEQLAFAKAFADLSIAIDGPAP